MVVHAVHRVARAVPRVVLIGVFLLAVANTLDFQLARPEASQLRSVRLCATEKDGGRSESQEMPEVAWDASFLGVLILALPLIAIFAGRFE
ncbi:unnamed protein product [Cladocopium goreaui]|uniref:Uncharacterized protein n=1 Tax=Cladocopium goreaui TaxID=2562237 RepID=A0A9P1G752_9DINO|nr:unnamed protein product [Cladocopium goreaui]